MAYQPYQVLPQFYQYPQYIYPNQFNNQMQMQQPIQQIAQSPPSQPQEAAQAPIRDGGFVRVQNEQEARNYLVARGSSVTFKDENAPYMYVKTVGFGQLDQPTFERWRLEREDAETPVAPNAEKDAIQEIDLSGYALKADCNALASDMEAVKEDIEALKKQIAVSKRQNIKKKDGEDDE